MSTPGLVSVLQRYVLAGVRLQLALRLVLAAFLGITLMIERPHDRFWLCILILACVPGDRCGCGRRGRSPEGAPASGSVPQLRSRSCWPT